MPCLCDFDAHTTHRTPAFRVRRKQIPRGNTSRMLSTGFTMVETLVALAVFGLFFTAIALILQQVLENVGQSRVRATALQFAQSKMELIRNASYADVGTTGGIPQGFFPQTETLTINGLPLTVRTSVIYVDDPFDGVAPADLINTDYKRVRIEITWGGAYPSRSPVVLVTNIVPKGVETVAGGGTLSIQVFNANGLPVPNATLTLDNTSITPEIHMQTLTNDNGLVILPGTPACITCYRISVTKTGYSTDRTYDVSEVANPLAPYATVIEGEITPASFAVDGVSQITVKSYDPSYAPISNVIFTLRGAKIIGHDTLDEPVYKYSYTTNTGGGTVTVPNLEWDSYTLDFSNSAHNLAGSTPTMPLAVTPASVGQISIIAVPKTNNSLLVTVRNHLGELQSSVSAFLTNGLGYDATKITPATGTADFGQVFFGGLVPSAYDLNLSLPGYQEATASLTISGIKEELFSLNPYIP